MGISKVVYGNETLVDLTNDTVSAEVLAAGYTATNAAGNRVTGTAKYAAAPVADGNAAKSNGILYGTVDSTSTATVFTATIEGLTELYDGVTVMLHNGVVTSASGFTVNINGLGAKPCYNNLTNATRETTIFNIAYTMMFVYSNALDGGNGGWWIYRGYDANTNTIGYQLRTNSALRPAKVRGYRYRIWFTALDGKHWVPANESSSTNATTSRTPSDEVIDPFGEIVYNSTNGTVNANANIPAATAWQQYTLSLGYSFNHEGDALNMTYPAPVYVKCQPQTSGGVVMKDYTQTLPSTDDGYVYLFLGMAYNATNIELFPTHPCYHYKDGAIRLWTNAAASSTVTVDSALSSTSENPVQNKVINAALEDHQEQIDEINDSISALPGGLPTPTSTDIGKVAMVVSETSKGAVIVPEQTVTCDGTNETLMSNTVPSLFTDGQKVLITFTFDGEESYVYESTVEMELVSEFVMRPVAKFADNMGKVAYTSDGLALYTGEALTVNVSVNVAETEANWGMASGGGGVLMVHMVYDEEKENDYTDKTWKEIYDAPMAALVEEHILPNGTIDKRIEFVSQIFHRSNEYSVTFYIHNYVQDEVVVDKVKLVTDSENGYLTYAE